jgi:type VI secretion system secreted protein VgrG
MALHRVDVHLESPDFPCERLQVREVRGRERISRLFEFEIDVSCPEEHGFAPEAIMGARVALVFSEDGALRRRVYGVLTEVVDLLNTETEFLSYRLRLAPRASRLRLIRTQEIYMGLTLRQILEQKLRLVGLGEACAFLLREEGEPREFVVQFDETDLAFVSRLAEHAGVSFYFDHAEGGDRIVFTDHNGGFRAVEGAEIAHFRARGERGDVFRLEAARRLIPATFAVHDYNYRTPLVQLASLCRLESGYAGGVVEYGAHFRTPQEGDALARVRAEEGQTELLVFTGEADLCTLTAGAKVTVVGHPRVDDLELLVVEVEHRASQVVLAGGGSDAQPRYAATFKAIPAAIPYRPPRETPRPRIDGVLSGIVEASPGVETEQAWIDDQGRYLVRMLFDTAPPGERPASLPIRMAQPHSGPGYGIHFPLRPGTEVLIAFTGGDPDRPVIVGSVPNAVTPTPIADKEAMRHRIRTWSGVVIEIDDGG